MCLIPSDAVEPHFDEQGRCLAYKIVYRAYARKADGGVTPRYYSAVQCTAVPLQGAYVSNRHSTRLTRQEVLDGQVHRGIHVILSRRACKDHVGDLYSHVVIEVLCHRRHLVAAGHYGSQKHAVFTHVEVLGPPGSWKKRLALEAARPARKPRQKKKEAVACA